MIRNTEKIALGSYDLKIAIKDYLVKIGYCKGEDNICIMTAIDDDYDETGYFPEVILQMYYKEPIEVASPVRYNLIKHYEEERVRFLREERNER